MQPSKLLVLLWGLDTARFLARNSVLLSLCLGLSISIGSRASLAARWETR